MTDNVSVTAAATDAAASNGMRHRRRRRDAKEPTSDTTGVADDAKYSSLGDKRANGARCDIGLGGLIPQFVVASS